MRKIRVFLAGIIQGSKKGKGIHSQNYRTRLKSLIRKHLPAALIYDPVANYPGSVNYDDRRARRIFFSLMKKAAQTDVLVAFLPEASLGTAIEIWEAHKAGVFTVVITPMKHNWAVKFLPDVVLEDVNEFEKFLAEGGLLKAPGKRRAGRK